MYPNIKDEQEVTFMTYKGVVKGKVIALQDGVALPEGTRVSVIPEESVTVRVPEHPTTLQEWLQAARQVRAQLPETSDAVDILRQLREERASR